MFSYPSPVMRRFRRVFAAAVPVMMVVSFAGAGSAAAAQATPAPAFTCTGTISNATTPPTIDPEVVPPGTYRSLAMPAGSLCYVFGEVTVRHGINLGRASALIVVDGSVPGVGGPFAGALTVQGPTSVGYDAVLTYYWDGTPLTVTPETMDGPVTVAARGLLGLLQGRVDGPVWAASPSAIHIVNMTVAGGITILGGGQTNDPDEAFIRVGLGYPDQFVNIQGSTVIGAVSVIRFNGSGVTIADANTLIGPLTFSYNQGGPGMTGSFPFAYIIGAETIFGSATCEGNHPAPNTGTDYATKATIFGPVLGNQASTCIGIDN